MFCGDTDGFTENELAIKKQFELINDIHRMGGEVLMSLHTLRFADRERELQIAKANESRGADISKIVTQADTNEQLNENFYQITMLNRERKVPFLYLTNGSVCRSHRIVVPVVGSALFLAVPSNAEKCTQPFMSEAKTVLKLCGFEIFRNLWYNKLEKWNLTGKLEWKKLHLHTNDGF